MDDWGWLRTAAIVIVWITVGGGALLASLWVAFCGVRAYGPDDDLMAGTGVTVDRRRERMTSFSTAQVGVHGLLGILTASFVTYAVVRSHDRTNGYIAALIVIALTAIPGALMFLKWRRGTRPAAAVAVAGRRQRRVEDRFPRALVYGHEFFVVCTLTAVILLLLVD